MEKQTFREDKEITCIHCITGNIESVIFRDGKISKKTGTGASESKFFIGPGLIDIQINGINGIDFNTPSLTPADILKATHYLLSKGVTTFFPTVITNSDENILAILQTIYQACKSNPIVDACVGGIHLEGPFISPDEGAKGAHDNKFIKPPDWKLFTQFQAAAGGKIKIITLAPEWEGSRSFIENCRMQGVLVSIGHSMANTNQINMAAKTGAGLSTHLGNGIPLMLPRHPNILWDQLASEELYASVIADGIHIPDSFIKVVMKNKSEKTILASDATCFTGLPPGEYASHIGGTVILDNEKRISLKSSPGILAGSAKSLLDNIETLLQHNLAPLGVAWQMASVNVTRMFAEKDIIFESVNKDFVLFHLIENEIQVEKAIKNGKIVFEK